MEPGPTVLFRRGIPPLGRQGLRKFAARLAQQVTGGRPFCCLVTRDPELRRLNRDFRALDKPTDVLSFPAGSPEGNLGDVAISIDRALAQSAALGHDLETEISVLMLHGVLHLLGHDHERDRGRMRRLENSLRRTLGLPSGLIERSVG